MRRRCWNTGSAARLSRSPETSQSLGTKLSASATYERNPQGGRDVDPARAAEQGTPIALNNRLSRCTTVWGVVTPFCWAWTTGLIWVRAASRCPGISQEMCSDRTVATLALCLCLVGDGFQASLYLLSGRILYRTCSTSTLRLVLALLNPRYRKYIRSRQFGRLHDRVGCVLETEPEPTLRDPGLSGPMRASDKRSSPCPRLEPCQHCHPPAFLLIFVSIDL